MLTANALLPQREMRRFFHVPTACLSTCSFTLTVYWFVGCVRLVWRFVGWLDGLSLCLFLAFILSFILSFFLPSLINNTLYKTPKQWAWRRLSTSPSHEVVLIIPIKTTIRNMKSTSIDWLMGVGINVHRTPKIELVEHAMLAKKFITFLLTRTTQ